MSKESDAIIAGLLDAISKMDPSPYEERQWMDVIDEAYDYLRRNGWRRDSITGETWIEPDGD